jgi:hypothetical protein
MAKLLRCRIVDILDGMGETDVGVGRWWRLIAVSTALQRRVVLLALAGQPASRGR